MSVGLLCLLAKSSEKVHHRGYVWIDLPKVADAELTAALPDRWNRVLKAPDVRVSEQRSHFKNQVLEHLASPLHVRHNKAVSYSPWIKWTDETVMCSALSTIITTLVDLKLGIRD